MIRKIIVSSAIVCLVAGCTGVTHTRIMSDKEDQAATGVRYYRGAPYLLIQPDGAGNATTQIVFLPDQTKLMNAQPYAVLSKNDISLSFANGVLTGSTEAGDTTALPNAVLDALGKLLPLAMAAAAPGPNAPATSTEPQIYKIIVSHTQVQLRSADHTFATPL